MKKTSTPITHSFSLPWWVALCVVILIGVILRWWQLGSVPSVLNRDEAALAYNAYLLKEVGRDEWNQPWPLALESFGDYKLPGYPLLLIGFFHFFGLSDAMTRAPSALAGVIFIVITYGVMMRLKTPTWLAVLTAGLVAITPLFVFYSRIAFEANVALMFFGVSWWLLLRPVPVTKKPSTFSWQSLAMSDCLAIMFILLGVFTYNTPFLLLPFMIVWLPLWRGLKKWRTWILPIIGMIAVLMLAASILLPITSQKSGITIFSDETVWRESVLYREQFSGIWQKILGNKYWYYAQLVVKNYLASFSPYFLVTRGGTHPWHQVTGGGHLYWVVYGLGWVGILRSLWLMGRFLKDRQKPFPKSEFLLLFWLVIGVAPAAITVDAPHATRSLFFVWAWVLLAGWGIWAMWDWAKNRRSLLTFLFLFLISVEAGQFGYRYFVQFAGEHVMWKPGFQAVLEQANHDRPDSPIAVVDPDGYHYVLVAWYQRVTPGEYFESVIKQQPNQIGFRYGEQVGKWHFIARPEDRDPSEKAVIFWEDNTWQVELF